MVVFLIPCVICCCCCCLLFILQNAASIFYVKKGSTELYKTKALLKAIMIDKKIKESGFENNEDLKNILMANISKSVAPNFFAGGVTAEEGVILNQYADIIEADYRTIADTLIKK